MVALETASTPKAANTTKPNWADLYREVAANDLCAGCGACVVACPRNVLAYSSSATRPYQTDEASGPDRCRFGEAGCDACTRVCARFRAEPATLEESRFGRPRHPEEVAGPELKRLLLRATQSSGQDGGLVTATLAWALRTGRVEGAVVAGRDPKRPWRNMPVIATTPEEVLASSGSRYTYSSNLLRLRDASPTSRLAFVGTPCQIGGLVKAQSSALKRFRPVVFSIALMCSEVFEERAFLEDLLEGTFGLDLTKISKINVKGRLLVHSEQEDLSHIAEGRVPGSKARLREGGIVDIPLREVRRTVRPQCATCTDFAGALADMSAGGVGMDGWTMAILRTPSAVEWTEAMLADHVIEARPASDAPEASAILERLASKQRERGLQPQLARA
jgi:coenzyme F420 hydrogenase subunit beta